MQREGEVVAIPVCVFAKSPRPGVAKTRLAAVIGPEAAAALAGAMLADTLARVARCRRAAAIVASAGPIDTTVPVWDQGEGDLGARIARVLRRGLADSGVIAIGGDAPTLPLSILEAACDALESGRDAISPAEDGGFVLLAVRTVPDLAGITWSVASTFEQTRARLVDPVVLPGWWDVDEHPDLVRLLADPGPAVARWSVNHRHAFRFL
jgi:glycosyltransferase A (GT-A) superfamily protein (DUF2064 family)